jgi:phosphatidylserine decarboxylase
VNRQALSIRREQTRQARRIHGSLFKFWVAVVGIKLSRLRIPSRRLRLLVYRSVLGKKYPPGLNEQEAERPLWEYPSLNAVFTRGIKPEYRPIPAETRQFLSPCDGTVQDMGRIEQGKLLTVKGIEYRLEDLLPGTESQELEGAPYAIVFLSPVDCHRVFCPHDGQLEEARHVPGYRLLVHPPFQRPEYPPYSLNERMIFRLSTALGPCVFVMVAGWGVGNITLPHAPDFRPRARQALHRTWTPPLPLRRGDWVATFELGSTVVLIAPPAERVLAVVRPNEKVRYGQPLFTYPG